MLNQFHMLRLVGWVLLAACGPTAGRLEPAPEPALPAAPPNHLVGDGHGPNRREAELDARRAIIEQLSARIAARSEAVESELNGETDRRTRVEVTSEADFDFAELIETIGFVETPLGFRTRVVLSRARALAVYRRQIAEIDIDLRAARGTLDQAFTTLDTGVLLKSEASPTHLLERRRRAERVLAALGEPAPPAPAVAADPHLTALRQRAVLRLQVESDGVPPTLRDGAIGAVSRALADRGCIVAFAPAGPPEPDRPTADFHLRLTARRTSERGLQWVDLGFSLVAHDARTRTPILGILGGPHFVHAGGLTDEQADRAAARRLAELLPGQFRPPHNELICR